MMTESIATKDHWKDPCEHDKKIAILQVHVDRLIGEQASIRSRVRANEKVVAIVSALGIGAGGILKSIPKLNQLLITRRVGAQDKITILTNILGNKISDIEMDLMVLLMENGHVMLLGEIIKRFDYLLDKDSEVIKVLITSSSKISDGEVQRISTNIENNIQKKVNVTTETDASIIGGLKLRVGNTLIDGSIYSRLQKIRETLIQV